MSDTADLGRLLSAGLDAAQGAGLTMQKGVVVTSTPLTVKVAGSTTAVSADAVIARPSAGDTVWCLVQPGMVLVLGVVARGWNSYQPLLYQGSTSCSRTFPVGDPRYKITDGIADVQGYVQCTSAGTGGWQPCIQLPSDATPLKSSWPIGSWVWYTQAAGLAQSLISAGGGGANPPAGSWVLGLAPGATTTALANGSILLFSARYEVA
jgi:hypothetical protein